VTHGKHQIRRTRGESGVVAVEFALVAPIILAFIFAIVEFGQMFNYTNDANQIAATGARYAAVNNNPSGGTLQNYLRDQADTTGLRNNISVCITYPNTTSNVGDPVKVSVTSDYKLVPLLGGATVTLHGEATMRIEQPPSTPPVYTSGC
jgi:Flp pilus assembly protein TadG